MQGYSSHCVCVAPLAGQYKMYIPFTPCHRFEEGLDFWPGCTTWWTYASMTASWTKYMWKTNTNRAAAWHRYCSTYVCAVIERWKEELECKKGTEIYLRYKHDKKLFQRYTSNARTARLTECRFTDNAALLATSREATVLFLWTYIKVAESFGLSVSIPKIKLMVVGRLVEEEDRTPINIDENNVEHVKEFPYFGSVIQSSGRMDADVEH